MWLPVKHCLLKDVRPEQLSTGLGGSSVIQKTKAPTGIQSWPLGALATTTTCRAKGRGKDHSKCSTSPQLTTHSHAAQKTVGEARYSSSALKWANHLLQHETNQNS